MSHHAAPRRSRRRPATGVFAAGLVAVATLVAVLAWIEPQAVPSPVDEPAPSSGPPPAALPTPTTMSRPDAFDREPQRWQRVVHRLDARRSRAFAASDAAGLTDVYARGAAVLADDRATLAAYGDRGLVVQGATWRLLEVRVRAVHDGQVLLRVVDRLAAASATTAAGVQLLLPRDRPSAHLMTLARSDAGWRIAAIRALSG